MYQVIQRSTTSYLMDSNANRGKGETIATGGEHDYLVLAAAEADARNLMQGEGNDPWTVEEDGEKVEDLQCEQEHVYDALIDLGCTEAEGERLLS